MQTNDVTMLQSKLDEHFKHRIEDIHSAIRQCMDKSIGAAVGASAIMVLEAYLRHIQQQQTTLMNLKEQGDPEKFANAVVQYLNRQYNLESQQTAEIGEVIDFTEADKKTAKNALAEAVKDNKEPIVKLKDMQDLATRIIKPY